MAEYKPIKEESNISEQKKPKAFDLWEEAEKKRTPSTFKVSGAMSMQMAKINRDLFTDMEEQESGNYIITGIERKVTKLDFEAFRMGVGHILSDQSQQTGHTDTHSGLTKKKAEKFFEQTGHTYYRGEIITTLNDLCVKGYGDEEATTQHRKAMAALIDTLHKTPVTITFPNGDEYIAPLCSNMGIYKRKKDGAIYYHLILNPIFCENVKNHFLEYPQNFARELAIASKKLTPTHYQLSELLVKQDKRKPFVRYIDTLIRELDLEEYYSNERGKIEQHLLSLFEVMKTLKVINSYETETAVIRRKKRIIKVTFHLNPNYVRKRKTDEDNPT